MRQFAMSLGASLLSALYWWVIFAFVYADALFSGDRNPALSPPAESEVLVQKIIAIFIGVLLYAGLLVLWQRATSTARA